MVDEHTNSLIIQAIYSDLERMLPLIVELDKPTPQILIEAHIVEATKDVSMELGVQWGGLYNDGDLWVTPGANSSGVIDNSLSPEGSTQPPALHPISLPLRRVASVPLDLTLGFALEDIGNGILAAQLSALQN